MPTRWFEVTIETPPDTSDAIANFLIESGAPGIESKDRGDRVVLIAYFQLPPPREALERYCAALAGQGPCETAISIHPTSDQDWANEWKHHTRAQAVGQSLYIRPSWDTATPPDRIAVTIDPGMAFGTGQHPTTRGCLELIEAATRRARVPCALDLGTGSGILAIALAKLGVGEVWAVDTDPVARTVAAQNAELNGVARHLHVTDSLHSAARRFALIVANLYADLLEQLATRLAAALQPNGTLIVSGFLLADEQRVCQAFAARGFLPEDRRVEESWVSVSLGRLAER